jgi:hypothetical protein
VGQASRLPYSEFSVIAGCRMASGLLS